jgi:hypothetical protein
MSGLVRWPIPAPILVPAAQPRILRPAPAAAGAAAQVAEVVLQNEDSASPFTVTKPASFAAGQVLVVVVVQVNGTLAALTAPSTGNDIWALEGSYDEQGTGSTTQSKVWAHPYNGGEAASWNFGYSAAIDACLALFRITDADTTPVIDVTSNTFNSSASSMDSPTITPAGTNDLLICTLGLFGNNNALVETDPSGMTDRGQTQFSNLFMALAAASEQLTSGSATGVRTWTSVTPTGQSAGTFSIAVKSSGAGGGPQTIAADQAIETETAQALGRLKAAAAAQAQETETAQPVAASKARATTQATETETAQVVGKLKARAATQTSETETAQAITVRKTIAIGQATETETGQAVTASGVLGQAAETETAQAITARKTKAATQATETETAQPITVLKTRSVTQAIETETGQTLGRAKVKAASQIIETETGQQISTRKTRSIGQASETETAQTVQPSGPKLVAVGQASETETAQPFGKAKVRVLSQAAEIEAAQTLTRLRAYGIAQALELETAFGVVTGVTPSSPPGVAVVGTTAGRAQTAGTPGSIIVHSTEGTVRVGE